MSDDWQRRLTRALESRMEQPGWRDPLWLRASDAGGRALVSEFSRSRANDSRALDRIPFRIASVTKVFVATAIFRLVEDDRLGLHDAIERHLTPATARLLADAGYDIAAILVDHLLRHTSGLTDHSSGTEFIRRLKAEPAHCWTRHEQLALAVQLPGPQCEPGAAFFYSDSGYLVLGEIVEQATGMALPSALRTLLDLDRLGLWSTFFDGLEPAPDLLGPLAHQWLDTTDATSLDPSVDLFGGGGLVSTLDDIDRFFRALFAGSVFRLPETLPDVLSADPTECGFDGFTHNGLVFHRRIDGLDCWGHTGFWGVLAAFVPERGLMLAATQNRSRAEGSYGPDDLLVDFVAAVR